MGHMRNFILVLLASAVPGAINAKRIQKSADNADRFELQEGIPDMRPSWLRRPSIPSPQKAANVTVKAGKKYNSGHPFLDLPPSAGSAITAYIMLNDLFLVIADDVKTLKTAAKLKVSSDLMGYFDSLRSLHDTLVKKLRIAPAAWDALPNCTVNPFKQNIASEMDCTDEELDAYVDISSHSFNLGRLVPGHTQCIMRLKTSVALMRSSMVKMSLEADKLIAQLASDPVPTEPDFHHYGDRGCDGDCEDEQCQTTQAMADMAHSLRSFYTQVPGSEGLCRELPPDAPRDFVVWVCKEKCISMGDCKGFTLYNGSFDRYRKRPIIPFYDSLEEGDQVKIWNSTQSKYLQFGSCRNAEMVVAAPRSDCDHGDVPVSCGDEFLGCFPKASVYLYAKLSFVERIRNRCCFRGSVANEYTQSATECFIKPRSNQLQTLDTAQTSEWIEALPTGGDSQLAKDFSTAAGMIVSKKLNGPALMAMGNYKVAEYLHLKKPANLEKFMCMVGAAKNGRSPEKCLFTPFLEWYRKVHSIVDPYVFWGFQIEFKMTKLGVSAWTLKSIIRTMANTKSYLKQYGLPRTGQTISDIAKFLDEYLKLPVKSAAAAKNLALAYSNIYAMSPLALASSVAWLTKTAVGRAWEQCWMVDQWLTYMDVNDPEKVDEVVRSAFGEAQPDAGWWR